MNPVLFGVGAFPREREGTRYRAAGGGSSVRIVGGRTNHRT